MKNIIKFLIIFLIVFSSGIAFSQGPPPPPDGDPNSDGGNELGGNAPIESGIAILLALGAAYGGRKTYLLTKKDVASE